MKESNMSDREFWKFFGALVVGLGATAVIFLVLAYTVVSHSPLNTPDANSAQTPQAIAERLKPVGDVVVASAVSTAVNTVVSPANAADGGNAALGKQTFETTCSVCHGQGIAGSPKFGDKAAWARHIAKGKATLYQHALHGFQGSTGVMPPK